MFNTKVLIREIVISFFIGSLPLLILNFNNPETDIVLILKTLNPKNEIFNYFILLFIFNLMIFGLSKYFLNSENTAKFLQEIHNVTHQIGFTIQGVYRAVLGTLPAAFGILIYRHGFQSHLIVENILSVVLFFGLIFMCYLFSLISDETEPKKKFNKISIPI